MVSFCWKINVLPNKIKIQFCFIDNVHEINNQSCCILSGPPCIAYGKFRDGKCSRYWARSKVSWNSSLVESLTISSYLTRLFWFHLVGFFIFKFIVYCYSQFRDSHWRTASLCSRYWAHSKVCWNSNFHLITTWV